MGEESKIVARDEREALIEIAKGLDRLCDLFQKWADNEKDVYLEDDIDGILRTWRHN